MKKKKQLLFIDWFLSNAYIFKATFSMIIIWNQPHSEKKLPKSFLFTSYMTWKKYSVKHVAKRDFLSQTEKST